MATNIQGNSASGAVDEGNPVKVGGKYLTTQPTLTDGQRGDTQLDARGNVRVTLMGPDSVTSVGTSALNADNQAIAANGLRVFSALELWNGAGWDRGGKVISTARLLSAAASTNATVVKASAGNVFKIVGVNANAAARYLKLYNKATSPTVGTDTPVWTFYLPPSTVNGGQFELNFGSMPLYFATGIGYALTTAAADADTGALTLADVVAMNIGYS
jgi:hypothetical protein